VSVSVTLSKSVIRRRRVTSQSPGRGRVTGPACQSPFGEIAGLEAEHDLDRASAARGQADVGHGSGGMDMGVEWLGRLDQGTRRRREAEAGGKDEDGEAEHDFGPDGALQAQCRSRLACGQRRRQDKPVPRGKGEEHGDQSQLQPKHDAIGRAEQRGRTIRLQPCQGHPAQDQNRDRRNGDRREMPQDEVRLRVTQGEEQWHERAHPEDERGGVEGDGGARHDTRRRYSGMAGGYERERREPPCAEREHLWRGAAEGVQ